MSVYCGQWADLQPIGLTLGICAISQGGFGTSWHCFPIKRMDELMTGYCGFSFLLIPGGEGWSGEVRGGEKYRETTF